MNLDLAQVCFNLLGLLLKVTLPCTIFTSLLRPYDPSFFREVMIILLLGMILFPVNALISAPLARLFRVPQGRRGGVGLLRDVLQYRIYGVPYRAGALWRRGPVDGGGSEHNLQSPGLLHGRTDDLRRPRRGGGGS